MLSKRPEDRPGSAAEVRRELGRIKRALTAADTQIASTRAAWPEADIAGPVSVIVSESLAGNAYEEEAPRRSPETIPPESPETLPPVADPIEPIEARASTGGQASEPARRWPSWLWPLAMLTGLGGGGGDLRPPRFGRTHRCGGAAAAPLRRRATPAPHPAVEVPPAAEPPKPPEKKVEPALPPPRPSKRAPARGGPSH